MFGLGPEHFIILAFLPVPLAIIIYQAIREPLPPVTAMENAPSSSSRRMNRKTFFAITLSPFLISYVAGLTTNDPMTIIVGLASIPFLFLSGVGRVHDFDHRGWWVLSLLIPIAGFLWVAMSRGTNGPNRYGSKPSWRGTR